MSFSNRITENIDRLSVPFRKFRRSKSFFDYCKDAFSEPRQFRNEFESVFLAHSILLVPKMLPLPN